jgi:hypoxanthine phosphoribosyltransferase
MKTKMQLHDKQFKPYISETEIQARIHELGVQIGADYKGKSPLFLGVLNGAFMFAADLMRACDVNGEIVFVKLSSYEGMQSLGKLVTVIGVEKSVVQDRDVIIIEDILDTGKTLHDFMQTLRDFSPRSLAIATFLQKPDALQYDVVADYVGFNIPNAFVVGYGLDYDGLGRGLSDLYQLEEQSE